MLAVRKTRTLVLEFAQDVCPAILEEVEGGLAIEGEHREPVAGCHAVAQALHSVAWSRLNYLGRRLMDVGDPHEAVSAARAEDARVRMVVLHNNFDLGDYSNLMRLLESVDGHGVCHVVKGRVLVSIHVGLMLGTYGEPLRCAVSNYLLPEDRQLAVGGLLLVLYLIEVDLADIWKWRAFRSRIIWIDFSFVIGFGCAATTEIIIEEVVFTIIIEAWNS